MRRPGDLARDAGNRHSADDDSAALVADSPERVLEVDSASRAQPQTEWPGSWRCRRLARLGVGFCCDTWFLLLSGRAPVTAGVRLCGQLVGIGLPRIEVGL